VMDLTGHRVSRLHSSRTARILDFNEETGMSMSDRGRGVSAGYSAGPNTAWSGWVIFAATMMVLVGCFTLIDGFVALLTSSFYGTTYHLLLGNYQSWGWWNLILGSLLVVTGLSLFTGSLWARIVG